MELPFWSVAKDHLKLQDVVFDGISRDDGIKYLAKVKNNDSGFGHQTFDGGE